MKSKIALLLTLFATIAVTITARASDIYWTNVLGGNWGTASNWSPNQVPDAGDNAFITDTGTYTITVDVDATLATLMVGAFGGTQTVSMASVTLTLNSSSIFSAHSALNLSGGELGGAGQITVNGPMTWTSGTLSGDMTLASTCDWSGGTLTGVLTVASNAVLTLSGAADKNLSAGRLSNGGQVVWSGAGSLVGEITFDRFNAITNEAGGVFEVQTDADLGTVSYGNPPGSFVIFNAGQFRKTAGTETNLFDGVAFYNTGAVEIQTGTVELAGGGSSSGSFNIAADAKLLLPVSHSFASSAQMIGAGSTCWSGGTITFDGLVAVQNVELAGATIAGVLALTGNIQWTAGTIIGAVAIASNAVLTISGAADKNFYSGRLSNGGQVVWSGAGNLVGEISFGAFNAITNEAGGVFEVQTDADLGTVSYGNPPGSFVIFNAGQFRKTAGTETNLFDGVAFYNTGAVEIQSGSLMVDGGYTQTAGATRVLGGSLGKSSFGPIQIRAGVLSGNGAVNANVSNGGEINPGGSFGALTINGSLTHEGRLNIQVGGPTAGTQFDVLTVMNNATLGGWLSLCLKNGYRPNVGDSFEIVRYGSNTGGFNQIFGLDLGAGLVLQPTFGPTNLVLLATNGPVQLNHLTFAPCENGEFDLRFTGLVNSNYVIQASTTLTNWLNLFTNSSPIGVIEYLDVDAPLYPLRFYRVHGIGP